MHPESPIVLSGVMSVWRQRYHLFATIFMCVLFAGMALYMVASGFNSSRSPQITKAPVMFMLLMAVVAVALADLQFRVRRQIIREFTYDGRELRFRTLAGSGEQIWLLRDIASISEPRGRAPGMGYLVTRHDKRRVILDYTLPNAAIAAARMKLDLQFFAANSA